MNWLDKVACTHRSIYRHWSTMVCSLWRCHDTGYEDRATCWTGTHNVTGEHSTNLKKRKINVHTHNYIQLTDKGACTIYIYWNESIKCEIINNIYIIKMFFLNMSDLKICFSPAGKAIWSLSPPQGNSTINRITRKVSRHNGTWGTLSATAQQNMLRPQKGVLFFI